MSLVIFFGMALFIFLVGMTVMSVTVYQWVQLKRQKQQIPSWIKSELTAPKAPSQG